jgi:cell division protein FtsB
MSQAPIRHSGRAIAAAGRLWQRWQAWLADGESLSAGQLPRFFLLFLLLFGVGMILISLVGDQGLIAYTSLSREARALGEDVGRLESRRVLLSQQIEVLRSDPDYIAVLARKRLGLVKPGETVLQLPRTQDAP